MNVILQIYNYFLAKEKLKSTIDYCICVYIVLPNLDQKCVNGILPFLQCIKIFAKVSTSMVRTLKYHYYVHTYSYVFDY